MGDSLEDDSNDSAKQGDEKHRRQQIKDRAEHYFDFSERPEVILRERRLCAQRRCGPVRGGQQ